MAGRPPKPTKLKILQGNPGRRPLPENEPQPTVAIPTRPGWLSPEAKHEWSRLSAELEHLGLLTIVDRGAFAAYCQSWALYVDAVKDLVDNGTSFTTAKGYEGPRPAVGMMVKMLSAMSRFGGKFGLSPADRAKIDLPKPEAEDEFSNFLKGKQKRG